MRGNRDMDCIHLISILALFGVFVGVKTTAPSLLQQIEAKKALFYYNQKPLGISAARRSFNPSQPEGAGFPPYDGVFGSPWGPGQFPGPGPTPFQQPPAPKDPSPAPPTQSSGSSSEQGQGSGPSDIPTYYIKRKPKKRRYPETSPTKKPKYKCACPTGDEEAAWSEEAGYYCNCPQPTTTPPPPPPKRYYRYKPKRPPIPSKRPCRYGYASGPYGGCKPPPPSPPPEEEDYGYYDDCPGGRPRVRGRCPRYRTTTTTSTTTEAPYEYDDEDDEDLNYYPPMPPPQYIPIYVPMPGMGGYYPPPYDYPTTTTPTYSTTTTSTTTPAPYTTTPPPYTEPPTTTTTTPKPYTTTTTSTPNYQPQQQPLQMGYTPQQYQYQIPQIQYQAQAPPPMTSGQPQYLQYQVQTQPPPSMTQPQKQPEAQNEMTAKYYGYQAQVPQQPQMTPMTSHQLLIPSYAEIPKNNPTPEILEASGSSNVKSFILKTPEFQLPLQIIYQTPPPVEKQQQLNLRQVNGDDSPYFVNHLNTYTASSLVQQEQPQMRTIVKPAGKSGQGQGSRKMKENDGPKTVSVSFSESVSS